MSDDEFDFDFDEENNDSEDSQEFENSPEFVTGFKQYEHIGQYNPLDDDNLGMDLDYRQRLKYFGPISGEKKFKKNVSIYIKSIDLSIDIYDLIKYIEKLENIEYKNPKAFVIAYYFISSKKTKKDFFRIVKKYIDEDLNFEDVIRYIRLINNIKLD